MTNPKSNTPCPPECRTIEAAHCDSDHVPSCPNAFRHNAEALIPQLYELDVDGEPMYEDDVRKPAPAPEPKQGSQVRRRKALSDQMSDSGTVRILPR